MFTDKAFASFVLTTCFLVLAGCQNEPVLTALPTPEFGLEEDSAGPEDENWVLIHVTPPESDDEDQDEETPAPGPDEVDCPERVLYDTSYFGQGQVEVGGYPTVVTNSLLTTEIAPGDSVSVVSTFTAVCGPIRWQGGDYYMAPSGKFGTWNEPFYGYNQAPMPLEDVGLNETVEIRSYQVSHVAEGQLFWPARENDWSPDNNFVGRDLAEGESLVYRFTFTATDSIPVGETFRFGLTSGVWTDLSTGIEIPFDNNFYDPMTVTVVE